MCHKRRAAAAAAAPIAPPDYAPVDPHAPCSNCPSNNAGCHSRCGHQAHGCGHASHGCGHQSHGYGQRSRGCCGRRCRGPLVVQLGRYVAGKVQEKRAEKKLRQAAENGYCNFESDEGGFVREGYAALDGDQKRMIENVERKEMWIDEKEV